MSNDQVTEKRRSTAAERIRAAREIAATEVDSRVDRQVLPTRVALLLSRSWYNVLVLTLLREGPKSKRYEQALAFADDLVWTALPKVSAADVARLQSMLPQLGRQLRSGLEMVAFAEDEIATVFDELKALYRSRIAERYREQLHMPSVRSSGPLSSSRPLRPSQLRPVPLDDIAPAAASSDARRAGTYVRSQVESLTPGAWLEFADPDGGRIRAKLSWVSPISKKFLFVSDSGTKLADRSFDELADEIARGETLLLEAAPVFKAVVKPDNRGS